MSNISILALEAKTLINSGNYPLALAKLDAIIEADKPKKKGRKSKLDLTLEKLGVTAQEMQIHWDEALEVNWKIQAIANCGKTWRDLNEYQLKDLINLKEKTLKQLAEKEEKERLEKEAKEKAKQERDYYNEHLEEILLDKLLKKEELTEKEYGHLAFEFEVYSRYTDSYKHGLMFKDVVFLIGNHYFYMQMIEDTTDMGMHQYQVYPVEVDYDKINETWKIKG